MTSSRVRNVLRSHPVDGRVVVGVVMIVGTSATIQIAAAIASGLFDQLGAAATSALRFALAAVVLVAAVRPRIRGRDRATWIGIGLYGVGLAVLNVTFFEAIDRMPLGLAVTFAFLAPLAVAIAGSRRRSDIGFALLAAAGVVILGGIDRPSSIAGVGFAVAAGCAWVGVAFAAQHVGRRTRNVEGLALAIPIAAVVCLPLGVGHIGALDARALALGFVIAVGGLILPYALELEALRRLQPRTVAVVYSVDPAIAVLVGLVALGQTLTGPEVIGVIAVVVASAGATLTTSSIGPPA